MGHRSPKGSHKDGRDVTPSSRNKSLNVTPKANTKNKEEEKRGGKSGKTSPPLSNSPQSKKKGKKGDDISGIDKGETRLKKDRVEKPVILDIEPKPDVKLFYIEWLIN
jgi:hypothetical protein